MPSEFSFILNVHFIHLFNKYGILLPCASVYHMCSVPTEESMLDPRELQQIVRCHFRSL